MRSSPRLFLSGGQRAIGALLLACALVAGCGGDTPSFRPPPRDALRDDAITVGSFDFAESRLLAELYSQALEAGGFTVRRAEGIGPRELVGPALVGGLVEVVPEYAGTAVQFHSLGKQTAGSDAATTRDLLATVVAPRHLGVLEPAAASDENTFVVRRDTARAYGLRALSDLAAVAPDLTFGGPPECASRALCLQGLRDVYGVEFGEVVTLDAGGPLTHQAMREGIVDVALLFSTDPFIDRDNLVALVDDRDLQPAENVVPLVHTETLEQFGDDLAASLDAVSARLTTDELRSLNARVESGQRSMAAIVAAWLRGQGIA